MKTVSIKRTLVASAAAVTLVGAALGVAAAQPAPNTDTTTVAQARPTQAPGQRQPGQFQQQRDKFLSTLAGKLGVSVDKLTQAMEETRKELGLPERGPGGPGGPGWHRGPGGGPLGPGLDVAAKAMGITVEQLRQELPGKSLSDVAKAHNTDPAKVAKALKDAANERIDQAVKDGKIPSDRASEMKQRAAERIDQMMTRQMPTGGPNGKGGPRGQGGPGRGPNR